MGAVVMGMEERRKIDVVGLFEAVLEAAVTAVAAQVL